MGVAVVGRNGDQERGWGQCPVRVAVIVEHIDGHRLITLGGGVVVDRDRRLIGLG